MAAGRCRLRSRFDWLREHDPDAVSVEELSQLRRAYPNYFADTRWFLNEVRQAIVSLAS